MRRYFLLFAIVGVLEMKVAILNIRMISYNSWAQQYRVDDWAAPLDITVYVRLSIFPV